jgi:hypothetical protein
MSDHEPSNLQQAMQAAAAPQGSPPANGEVDRLLSAGDRLLRVQQARLATAWADHERSRVERLNWYRTEMRRLADEAEHELLMLDRTFDHDRRKIESVIAKLKAMRAA